MKRTSQRLVRSIVAVGFATIAGAAGAQAFPTKPVRVFLPLAPGGVGDITARLVAQKMSDSMGQQVLIENRPGAGGVLSAGAAARAEPDGYTIVMGQMGTHAASVALYPNLAYKPDEDFAPIGQVASFPFVVATKKDFPADNLKDFMSYVKANDTKLNQGHAGVGSMFFTSCLLLNSLLGTKPTLVPFNGGAPAMNALVGGQTDFMCADVVTGAPQFPDKIKILAVTSPKRNAAIPNVPSVVEAGLPDFQATAWNGLFAPKGTPQPILDRLVDALNKALDDPETRKRLDVLGGDIPDQANRGPAPFHTLVKSEIARWSPIIKAANVKMN